MTAKTTQRSKQLYFEDVQVGMEPEPFVNTPDLMTLNWFAGANRELVYIHMDRDYSKKIGLPDVIIMGNLKANYIANMLDDWMGEDGRLFKLKTQYRGMDVPDDTLTAKGRVTAKRQEGGKNLVDLDVWVENQKGQTGTVGSATVILPSRGARG